MTTVLSALKDYIMTYSGIGADAVVMVDSLSGKPTEFAIIPQPGPKILQEFISGSSDRQFPFALQMMAYTTDDATRMANNGFFEAVSDWLESQTNAGTFPTLNSNQNPTKIEATGQPFLFQEGESGISVYQMNCNLEYHQDAPA